MIQNGGARIYERVVFKEKRWKKVSFGCLPGVAPQRLFNPWGGRGPTLMPGSIALAAPWVAALENFIEVDTGELAVSLVDLRTGKGGLCSLGRWSSSVGQGWFQMSGLVANAAGFAAWIGTREEGLRSSLEVAACKGSRVERLDKGPEIALQSMHLDGSILSWTSGAKKRKVSLPAVFDRKR